MKKIKVAFLPLALVSVFISNSQSYSSSYEESIFLAYKKDSLNYNFFDSLTAIDSLVNEDVVSGYYQNVLSVIKKMPPKEVKDKKEKKRVRNIYDELHNTFFRKYELSSYFTDMFKDGTYNCVTATALYAFAFEMLEIPYHIKETPSHVFLIAYPDTYKIYLETTVPGAYGFAIPKESEVKKMVDELIAYKLATKEEVSEKGYMKFYEDYYYGKEFIDKGALIGMQYYNKGLTNLEVADYDNALNNFRKSKVFYSSVVVNYLLKNVMFLKINELEFNSLDDIDFLVELLEISNYTEDYTLSNLKSSLYKIVDHDDNDKDFIAQAIAKFKLLKKEDVKNECVEFLYEYLARRAASDEYLDDALEYSDAIIQINSKSKIAKQIIEYVAFRKVALSSYDVKALNALKSSCKKYPFLKDNNRYNISLVHLFGQISYKSLKNKEITKGIEYLKKLEEVLDNTDVLQEVDKGLLAELYLKAGNYYYFKEQYKTSYKLFKRGLIYAPGYPDLVKKAQWSKEEL
ncbi:hypothetical protein [Aestuariivivens insulae]|uniref:hypothetical protein n=1 Tax=Aestuariivivens insulae TaxID=1621988 RepID=UPI001F571001|nr:hypothetical protein [Aestuariivivens insulae]